MKGTGTFTRKRVIVTAVHAAGACAARTGECHIITLAFGSADEVFWYEAALSQAYSAQVAYIGIRSHI